MKATILKNTIEKYSNIFAGNYDDNLIPDNKIAVSDSINNDDFHLAKWNGTEWIEGATPEEIQQQQLEQQKLLKQQQYEELLPTDWYVIRFLERGIPIPEEITQQRQEIINRYN